MKLNLNFNLFFLMLPLLGTFVGVVAADSIGDTLGGKALKTLYTGDEMRSPNRRYQLVMQTDCNLVFYGPQRKVIWASNTQNAGKLCVMKLIGGDTAAYGNALQITDYQQNSIWRYSENSNGDCYLKVDDRGALLFPCVKILSNKTITNPGGEVLGYDTIGGPECRKGKIVMFTGDYITSRNGAYRLVIQTDCNLVLYHQQTGSALWASQTVRSGMPLCQVFSPGPINSGDPPIYDCFGHSVVIQNYLMEKVWSIQGNGYCGITLKNNGHLIFNCKAYVHGIGDPRNKKSAIAAVLPLSQDEI
ncbi:hypothetical protein SELMODRAFT_431075 [Selaginella moellendorffii]|uniref:Bulb-type lectin domain-containing protein n=1 Tax=Selaginella moellendorffii TaxID=88036 RepID=D8TBE1_SELML|nr:hypothetical protein SELMODRAFT_431075 [Selaginella moellendorffii]